MAHRCQTCGRTWEDQDAADNDYRCVKRCGGVLAPERPHASVADTSPMQHLAGLPSLLAICDDGVFLDAETKTAIGHGSPRALRDGSDHPTIQAFMRRSEAIAGREPAHVER